VDRFGHEPRPHLIETMAEPPLLALSGIRYHLGDQTILDGVELAIAPGERLSLVGRNGAGKSTLLRILVGEPIADSGTRFAQPSATIASLPQEPDFSGHASVAHYVASALADALGPSDYRVASLLDEMKLDGARDPSGLSGGEARRTALARALVAEPDVLLLDEPTNHLDLPTIEWLEEKLSAWKGAYVLVSHDRRFLADLSRAVLWLDRGIVRRLDKGYAAFDDWSNEILEREATERHKLDRLIERETEWAGKSIRARRTRNEGRLRQLNALRKQRQQQIGPVGRATIEAGSAEQSGALAITARNISKRWGERVIVENFSTRIFRKDRIGLIGPNGAGKTTLLRLLIGELLPDTGSVKLGANLVPVVIDQRRAALDPDKTPWEILADRNDHLLVRGRQMHVMSYLREYLFRDEQARQPVRTLSGGERNRLLLAQALAAPSNLLVLDEPTNDLDADTLDLLQEALSDYDGTVLLVSHDRDFLDRLVTSTIALEGDGTAIEYAGGYSDYVAQRGPRQAPAAATPRKEKPVAPREAAVQAKRLGYKRERALAELPKKIDALHAEIASLHQALADPDLYRQDAKAFAAKTARLGVARSELEAAETEWLELEILREELKS
jgi:ABC transport system ATP-binding/permease protein